MTDKSTNTKDLREWFNDLIHEVYPSEPGMLDIGLLNKRIYERIAKDRQQLLQRVRKEVIGEEKLQTIQYKTVYGTPKTGKRKKAGWKVRDSLRQTQREILEAMEEE